ncbi:TonB-dependent receptor [Echinicola soli]|uniref:TonB-dependent receptor n=1 Tax=Echinicola soli TaxID=2591634 RepID=A0A514CJA6_9BACT|nr:TonB-dependent receptor [Echinicola soli]QDH79724.1 TonB-dependent receptor [Echinicola soli]
MKSVFSVFILFFIVAAGFCQQVTISGTVQEEGSKESLIGVNIFDKVTEKGTVSNRFGYFSYTTESDSVDLYISYVGFKTQRIQLTSIQDTVLNVALIADGELAEVVVSAQDMDRIQEVNRMSTIDVPIHHIKELPALLGEVDVIKVLQLLPGVQSGTEGASGLYVRGGGPDQNLILLDGVPIYNASHLFGFFSVFNADALNNVELIKGGFPSRFGGRLSSVVDVTMREGNMEKIKGEGSIGIISSKVTVDGPIQKGKTSFLVSARRTYLDLLARPLIKAFSGGDENSGYYFYDLNGKVNHKIDDRNRLYFSVYKGDDKAYNKYSSYYVNNNIRTDYDDAYGIRWGNFISALRWNNVINNKLFSNYTFTYSKYHFDLFSDYYEKVDDGVNTSVTEYTERYFSGIRDWAGKVDFDYVPNPDHYIRFGANVISHKFSPGVYVTKGSGISDMKEGSEELNSTEYAIYIEDDIAVTDKLKANLGAHYSGFMTEGKHFQSLQPRIAARYLVNGSTSIKASYVKMAQYIHLLTNAGLGLPTDLWVPATAAIGPQKATQVGLGIARSYRGFEISLEGYYKTMDGLIEYRDGATYLNVDENWENKVAVGEGRSYGLELLIQKKIGKISGWLGYTLSKTDRQFEEINFGKWYPYKYDRRHDISLALTHEWKDNKDFSLAWVYGTGNAFSLPSLRYEAPDREDNNSWYYNNEVEYYESRNNFRNRDYHRLDLSFSWWKTKKWGERKWTLAIYNVYNRRNPFFMDLGYDNNGNKKVVQYSLFPFIPSVTYGFKF